MSADIFGNDETIETTAVSVRNVAELIAPNAIRQQHKEIGADMVQRIQMMFDRKPTIEAYSVEKDYSGRAVENIKLKLDGAMLSVSLRSD